MLREKAVVDYIKDFVFAESKSPTVSPPENRNTVIESLVLRNSKIPRFVNEFWTAKQRQASSIHEISYRACFKAQLPRFFIELLSAPGDIVYDPFSGRGTTIIEAALLGRRVMANDINPLSRVISRPRLAVPAPAEIAARLDRIPVEHGLKAVPDLSMFFHPDTEGEIVSLKQYLEERSHGGREDDLDRWIRMVATNRLTGHSAGFFSVYTLPPNQAVSPESQLKINEKRRQQPGYRNTRQIILRKTWALLKNLQPGDISRLRQASATALFLEEDAAETTEIPDGTVRLTVTSPPFLDIVQYSRDNWLRCWFNDIDTPAVEKRITMSKTIGQWSQVMGRVFLELYRVTAPGGWVAFEVGEVKNGKINLEEHVVPLGLDAGFKCVGVVVNLQEFTKTANIWGIKNNRSGTNSNRIALFHKD